MKNKTSLFSSPTISRLGALSLACAFALTGTAGRGQAPAYVVTGWTTIATPASQSITGGSGGNYAVNSEGDFFYNDGAQHVIEVPANGGSPVTLFTLTSSDNNLGVSGVAVDPADNLYITNPTYNGPNTGSTPQLSQIFEMPYTNGAYPAPYTFTGALPAQCVAGNTAVCTPGNYTSAANYYWLPLNIAADGLGDTFMYTLQDNTFGSGGAGGYGIFRCNLACNQQALGGIATTYTVKLPNSITSIAADYAGDVFFTDMQRLYMIPASSPTTNNTPAVFDYSYNQPYGVTIDNAGNLYVSDMSGIWKTAALETGSAMPCKGKTDSCTLTPYASYLVAAVNVPNISSTYVYGNQQTYMGAAVDNRGNLFFNTGMPSHYQPVPIVRATQWGGTFPPTAVNTAATSAPSFNVVFNSSTTIASITAVQEGAPASEFTVSPGSCAAGVFAARSSCSFPVSFTPSAVGPRKGSILITDSNGNTTTTLVSGMGTGSAIAVDPGTPRAIGTTFSTPAGIAIDHAGDVFVADPGAGTVKEYPGGGGTAIALGASLSAPVSVALDARGDLYILNQGTTTNSGSVVEVPTVAGVPTTASQKTLLSGLSSPSDLVLDGSGNLYITETGANTVIQASSASLESGDAALVNLGSGLNAPTGIALDSSGNVYVADTGNNRVLEIGDGFLNVVGNGTTAPTGVAVDASGSVMIADGSGRILRVPNEDNPSSPNGLNQADQQVLATPLTSPYSLRVDSAGNLYASDRLTGNVDEIVRTTGTINFGNWNVNTVSDTQTIVLSNIGTSTISLGTPLYPAIAPAAGFSVTAPSSLACTSGAFYSGYSCNLGATFAPTSPTSYNYPLVFAAAAQNTATPTMDLVGKGVTEGSVTLTIVQTAPTGTITYGEPITFTANVTPTTGSVTPTGYVVFTFDGQTQTPIALTAGAGGTATAALHLPAQNAGAHSVSAYYEGDANYAEMRSAVTAITITLATATNVLTVTGDSATPLSSAPNHSLVLTDTLTPSVSGIFGGTVTFSNALTPSAPPIAVVKVGSPNAAGAYVVSYTYQNAASGLPLGTENIIATYSGNSNYSADTSDAVTAVVTNPTFTLTPSGLTITSSRDSFGSISIGVTDYSNFQGGVVFNCSGLPANAYCVFRPISIGFAPETGVTPVTIAPATTVLQVQVDQNLSVVEGSFGIVGCLFTLLLLAIRYRRGGARGLSIVSVFFAAVLGVLVAVSGCSSGALSRPSTPTGSYPIVITATGTPTNTNGTVTSANTVQQFNATLIVQ
jgi:sugar lactone lactonase YvrE